MNKVKLISAIVVVLGITVAVLLNNKSKMQAKSKAEDVHFLPVTLVSVGHETLTQELSLTGTVTANNDVAVLSETTGRIVKVNVSVGDRVDAGTVLVQVDDELKRAALVAAEVNNEKAQKDLKRYEVVHKDGSVSDAQLEGARLAAKSAESQYIIARRLFEDTRIKSPIAGIVTSRPVDVGTTMQNNMLVANVVDISKLKVKVNVAESDVFRIRVGDSASVSTEVYPGVKLSGTISTISSKADDAHTYAVEVLLANSSDHPLKAGMFARVQFTVHGENSALSIPRQALVGSMKQPQVFVVANGVARLRDIVLGGEYETRLKVLSGLTEGEKVVFNGQNNLKDSVAVSVMN